MYKKVWCACKLVVLLHKPIAFLTFSLPSPSSLLKLPILARLPIISLTSLATKPPIGEMYPNLTVSLPCTDDWYGVNMFMYSYLVMLEGGVCYLLVTVGRCSVSCKVSPMWGNQPEIRNVGNFCIGNIMESWDLEFGIELKESWETRL